jgi:hypothetical protein
VMDEVNTISHWPLVDDHKHMPKVQVSVKQPRDTDEKRGLTIHSARSMVRRVLRKYPTF